VPHPTSAKDFEAFSLYSMRQAIEEGFILDVLESYATYATYWKLKKRMAGDPRFEKRKAMGALRAFAEQQDEALAQKVAVILDHFLEHVEGDIGGKAKGMVVTRSRAHAVLTRPAMDRAIEDRHLPFKALVAFSGKVAHAGREHTETSMNGFPESQTADTFKGDEYRFLVVANKFQTGFDQPLLAAMYVDKKLGGVAAVQTLSRLNRTMPGRKLRTFVLDFANEAAAIQEAFQLYFERTLLSEATDPDLLHDLEQRILDADLVSEAEVEAFGDLYFASPPPTQDQLYAQLKPFASRFRAVYDEDRRAAFRSALDEYVRLYAFLSQIISFTDPSLERLHVFGRHLLRYLGPAKKSGVPPELLAAVRLSDYEVRRRGEGRIALQRGTATVEPQRPKNPTGASEDDLEELSLILRTLNDRFGTAFKEEDRVFIEELEGRLDGAPALAGSLRVNPPDTVRLTFDNLVGDLLQDMMDANFTLYQRVTDDEDFGRYFLSVLFDRFLRRRAAEGGNQP
jgi:type I restriction enzyme R subunit